MSDVPGAGGGPPSGRPEADSKVSVVRAALGDRDLVVVSNREPYSHDRGDDGIEVSRPAGGLTSALDPLMRSIGGTWVAWGSGDADWEVTNDESVVGVPRRARRTI